MAMTPKYCGQPAGLVECRVKQLKPLVSFKVTAPAPPSDTTPAVTGLPEPGKETNSTGTAWVKGLSGTWGLNRIGAGLGRAGWQWSAEGSAGNDNSGAGTLHMARPLNESP